MLLSILPIEATRFRDARIDTFKREEENLSSRDPLRDLLFVAAPFGKRQTFVNRRGRSRSVVETNPVPVGCVLAQLARREKVVLT